MAKTCAGCRVAASFNRPGAFFPMLTTTTMLLALILITCTSVNCNSWLGKAVGFARKPLSLADRWSSSSSAAAPQATNKQLASQSGDYGQGKNGAINSKSSGRSSDDDDDNDYQSLCLIERNPNRRTNPSVFFFSAKRHNEQTLGCTRDIEFKLNSEGNNRNSMPGRSYYDADIRSKLIDSGLYDGQLNTYVLVHGFLADWTSDTWMCKVKDLILNSTDANVFIIDWSDGSKPVLPMDYGASVADTQHVGELMGTFIRRLVALAGQRDADRFHLIGHSLGAHISGYIGYTVKSVGRITALDPAGPCFSLISAQARYSAESELRASQSGYLDTGARRLSPESAKLVLALHTDTTFFGLDQNCAHYDVYVNGGVKQPDCNSFNPADRLMNLVNLNLADTLDFNVACAHSYAHDLLDTIGTQLGSTILGSRMHEEDGSAFESQGRCAPMAYRCGSWAAFRAGECGFCRNNDTRCVFTGIDFDQDAERLSGQAKLIRQNSLDYQGAREHELRNVNADDEDGSFNDEDSSEDSSAPTNTQPSVESIGRHFIKTGTASQTCLYHYQVLIAMEVAAQADGVHFYVQIPVGSSDRPSSSSQVRLVQVSHLVPIGTTAHSFLIDDYLDELSDSYGLASKTAENSELLFYTALITFVPLSDDECDPKGGFIGTQPAGEPDKWRICQPLEDLRETRLWAPRRGRLQGVKWLALNYMSGISQEVRAKYSHLFVPDTQDGIKKRKEVESGSRPRINELEGSNKFNPFSNPLGTLVAPVDCLMSTLTFSEAGASASNLKCGKSSAEMKYAIKMVAKRRIA